MRRTVVWAFIVMSLTWVLISAYSIVNARNYLPHPQSGMGQLHSVWEADIALTMIIAVIIAVTTGGYLWTTRGANHETDGY